MIHRRLGKSGLVVSPICLGTMMFGGATDAGEAERIVGSARDAGINFVDTADIYNDGESERILGRLIGHERDRWVVATKVGNPIGPGLNQRGLGRVWMMRAVEDSLRRLNTDYIDIYYLHLDDAGTPLEETVGALGDLIRAGRIRHFGFSNYRGWRIAELVRQCGLLGVPRPVVGQPYYNLLNRMPEVEYLPACGYYGIGVVPYSPLARGVLTGKYRPGAEPDAGSRAGRKDARMMETEFRRESLEIAQELKAHAEARGMTPGQFALNWVLRNRFVSSVLAGPRTLEQWQDYLGALDHHLDEDDEALVDRLVAPGHPSTPGYTDPKYPVMGR